MIRRTIYPYDLTSGDNPGTIISRPLLHNPNYDEWSASIRLVLKARNKFAFADGTIPQPYEESEHYEDWWCLGSNSPSMNHCARLFQTRMMPLASGLKFRDVSR